MRLVQAISSSTCAAQIARISRAMTMRQADLLQGDVPTCLRPALIVRRVWIEFHNPIARMKRKIPLENIPPARLRQEYQSDNPGHRGDYNRIPQPEIDAAALRVHREHHRRQQSAEPAVADVIRQ